MARTWQDWIDERGIDHLFVEENDKGESVPVAYLNSFFASKFEPTREDRKLAWILYAEMHSRIVTRKLHYGSGDEKAALKSVWQLFDLSRRKIEQIGPECHAVATLMMHVLNVHVEKLTSKWHAKQEDGEFENEDSCRVFRLELSILQQQLIPFKEAIHSLHNPKAETQIENLSAIKFASPAARRTHLALSAAPEISGELENEFKSGWPETTAEQKKRLIDAVDHATESRFIRTGKHKENFDNIEEGEREEIVTRRKSLHERFEKHEDIHGRDLQVPVESLPASPTSDETSGAGNSQNDSDKLEDTVGLAFSGGGIRAGTFAMGVTQRLAEQGILHDVDYLSTVSGGGYFGSFMSCYLDSPNPDVGLHDQQVPFRVKKEAEPKSIRHLRNNASYLTSGGSRAFQMFGVVFYGLVVNLLILFPLVSGAVILTRLFMTDDLRVIVTQGVMPEIPYPEFWLASVFALVGVGVLLSTVRTIWRGYEKGTFVRSFVDWYASACLFLLAVFLLISFVNLIPWMAWVRHNLPYWLDSLMGNEAFFKKIGPVASFISAVAVPMGLRFFAMAGSSTSAFTKVMRILYALSGPLFYFYAYFLLVEIFVVDTQDKALEFNEYLYIYLFALPLIIGWIFTNVNFVSPHLYYRNRLCDAFLLKPENKFVDLHNDEYEDVDIKLLSKMRSKRPELPYHLINGVLNAPASSNPDLRGRRSDFYIFSQRYCGSPLIGFEETEKIEQLDNHVNLGTAMAISAAAAAPQSGSITSKESVFLLTLVNARLGYWLRNPNSTIPSMFWFLRRARHPSLRYLLAELFSLMWDKFKFFGMTGPVYHNISDGGHLENLGVYELLRRRCKFIIAVDGEADPGMKCESMLKLIRYARIDFGIEIYFDPKDFKNQENGFAKSHFSIGVVDYGKNEELTEEEHRKKQQAAGPNSGPIVKQDVHDLGIIIYLKNNMTGNESPELLNYRDRPDSGDFPHVSVADQFFDEEQFEAFRSLGYHVADTALGSEIFDGRLPDDLSVSDWAKQLVEKLYSE